MAYLEICIEYFPFVLEGVGPFTMLRISYSAKNVVWYRCNNIVLGGKGGTNTKSQNFLHLIFSKQIAKQILVSMFVVARKY